MAWWLLAPVAVYAAKKLYDVINDDGTPTMTSSYAAHIGVEKARRTRARKAAIREIIGNHRNSLREQIHALAEAYGPAAGTIQVDDGDTAELRISFPDIDSAMYTLRRAEASLVSLSSGESTQNTNTPEHISLEPQEAIIERLLRKANSEFGEMAGIGADGLYQQEDDPFFHALMKVAREE